MKYAAFVGIAFLAFVVWAGTPVSWAGDGRNVSSINGGVTASPGETYGTLSTVNGNVHVGRGAIADHAKTVNGEISIEDSAKLGEVNTVNGSLEIGDDVTIERTASTVNGSVELGKRTHVGGDVSTVSGEIELKGAEVGGKLTTRNGDIDLSDGARVRGGILVKKSNDDSWGWKKDNTLHVHICSTCVVDGELRFERPVELRVDQGAKIGQVIGDSVTRR
jgi:cytoskeletal protein CcmA (bactofilin family)